MPLPIDKERTDLKAFEKRCDDELSSDAMVSLLKIQDADRTAIKTSRSNKDLEEAMEDFRSGAITFQEYMDHRFLVATGQEMDLASHEWLNGLNRTIQENLKRINEFEADQPHLFNMSDPSSANYM